MNGPDELIGPIKIHSFWLASYAADYLPIKLDCIICYNINRKSSSNQVRRGINDNVIAHCTRTWKFISRLVLVFKFGGLYLDSDIVTVKPIPKSKDFGNAIMVQGGDVIINNAVIQFSKKHRFLYTAVDILVKVISTQ